MPLPKFEAPASPVDAISKAMGVASAYYGVKHSQAATDALNQLQQQQQTKFQQEQDELSKLKDKNSAETKGIKADAASYLSLLAGGALGKKNPEALTPLQDLVNDPNTTGYQIKNNFESSPLLKYASTMASKNEGLAMMAAAMQGRNARADDRIDLNANSKYRQELGPYEGTIQAANRADEIINKIKAGGLKSTPTLATDLNSSIGQMFNQGKGATVYSMSHTEMDSAFKRAQNALGFIQSAPKDTIPAEQLDQLQKDVQSLRAAYYDAHDVAYNSFREGLPERVKAKLDERFNKFRELANGKPSGGSGAPGVGSTGQGQSGLAYGAEPNPQPSNNIGPPSHDDIRAELAKRKKR